MLEEYLQNPWLASLAVVLGGAALIAGGEALVRGASKIALGLKISPLIVGLTIVALCTSAPEMAVSLSAALGSDPAGADVALGNVVGSNICNVLLILGICALIKPLSTSTTLVKRDFPLVSLFSLATLAAVFVARQEDGSFRLPQLFGFLLLAAFVVYEIVAIRQARRDDTDAQNIDVAEESQEKKNAKYWLRARLPRRGRAGVRRGRRLDREGDRGKRAGNRTHARRGRHVPSGADGQRYRDPPRAGRRRDRERRREQSLQSASNPWGDALPPSARDRRAESKRVRRLTRDDGVGDSRRVVRIHGTEGGALGRSVFARGTNRIRGLSRRVKKIKQGSRYSLRPLLLIMNRYGHKKRGTLQRRLPL